MNRPYSFAVAEPQTGRSESKACMCSPAQIFSPGGRYCLLMSFGLLSAEAWLFHILSFI